MSIRELKVVFGTQVIRVSCDSIQFKLRKVEAEVTHTRVSSLNHVHAEGVGRVSPGIIGRHDSRAVTAHRLVTFTSLRRIVEN